MSRAKIGTKVSDETRNKMSKARTGRICLEKTKELISKAQKMSRGHNWKGGRIKGPKYWHVKIDSHPFGKSNGYVLEHRLIMEKHLGRYLTPSEVVHHINLDTFDNRIENLIYFPNSGSHTAYHHQLRKLNNPEP